MQAIEFETLVQDQSIPLPESTTLSTGQRVRVVVMFDSATKVDQPAADDDALIRLARNPLVISDFVPLSRDEAHAR
ncbi:hypothetical protein [Imhoffiella purpurea]|uniref:DUF104 domain-containing protein n=1 Tax=Imhoffiella purpurea TaxID=1249627 RepID=W9VEU3_9GAMM|nr:hypothetical protein [Imhoffiella purpurea]EXJ14562.1 hypothetical protein D779_2354 [Imhoffiella purpurea]